MLSKTYDAFVAAGAPDDKARAAAEEVANMNARLIRLEITTSAGAVGVLVLLIKAFV